MKLKKIYNYKNLLLVFGDYNVITREMNTIFLPKELEMSFLKNKKNLST